MTPVPAEPQKAAQFFAQILLDNGLTDEIKDIKVRQMDKGDAFRPDNQFVTIEFKNEESKPLELFVKRPPSNEKLAAKAKEGRFFEKEAFFYNVFLPDAQKFCQKREEEIKLTKMFAKCYFANSEVIVLENLVSNGYFMTPNLEKHTFFQSQAVLENLGTFQAASYAMLQEMGADEFKDTYPLLIEENVLSPDGGVTYGSYWETVLELALKTLKMHPEVGGQQEIEFLEKYKGTIYDKLCEVVKCGSEDVLHVVNLGDLWSGNTLCIRDPVKKIYKSQVLVDMQETRLGSPMLDISSYMFSSVRSHIHSENWAYLLDVFFEFFRDTSDALGVEFKLTLNDLKEPYKAKSLYGLFCGIAYQFEAFLRTNKPKDGEISAENLGFLLELLNQEQLEVAVKNIASEIVTAVTIYQKYFDD